MSYKIHDDEIIIIVKKFASSRPQDRQYLPEETVEIAAYNCPTLASYAESWGMEKWEFEAKLMMHCEHYGTRMHIANYLRKDYIQKARELKGHGWVNTLTNIPTSYKLTAIGLFALFMFSTCDGAKGAEIPTAECSGIERTISLKNTAPPESSGPQ